MDHGWEVTLTKDTFEGDICWLLVKSCADVQTGTVAAPSDFVSYRTVPLSKIYPTFILQAPIFRR